jgi:DnaK suppressor protein
MFPDTKDEVPRKMATDVSAKSLNRNYNVLEKALIAQRDELSARINGRINEVRIDREPDDSAALASDRSTRDMVVATLDRERRTLEEIHGALSRIAKGKYGICGSCDEPIPDARLKALPWARVCVRCAEQSFAGMDRPVTRLDTRTHGSLPTH